MNLFQELNDLKARLTLSPEENYALISIQKGEFETDDITKALRKLLDNKSVAELAEIIGISKPTIYRALKNNKITKSDARTKILDYLDYIGYRFQ